MNDAFYEQLVARKSRPTDMLLRILTILVIAAIAILGMPFLGMLAFLIAILAAVLAYYFIFPRLDVEYEYVLLNHDMDIDAIYSKTKRKRQLSFDIRQAEIMAPTGSPRLNSFHPSKTMNFSSGRPDAKSYTFMVPLDNGLVCIILEPDETMYSHIQSWMGSKLYRD